MADCWDRSIKPFRCCISKKMKSVSWILKKLLGIVHSSWNIQNINRVVFKSFCLVGVNTFLFLPFSPKIFISYLKKSMNRNQLRNLADEQQTCVFFSVSLSHISGQDYCSWSWSQTSPSYLFMLRSSGLLNTAAEKWKCASCFHQLPINLPCLLKELLNKLECKLHVDSHLHSHPACPGINQDKSTPVSFTSVNDLTSHSTAIFSL